MPNQNSIFDLYAQAYESQKQTRLTLKDYLEGCRTDPTLYAGAAERMIAAIGEPELVDTAKDARLSRIYMNRTLKVYPAFRDFYGLEETIERIVGFFRHAAQGLEERKQVLYLLGPVGGGKSSLAERLKDLMEQKPIYVLATPDQISPIFESPLGLFDPAGSRKPSRVTRTIRISRRWSARSISASSSTTARTTLTPIPTRAASTARRRGCSSSSKCSRRRSRCCTRC